jgi:ABC-type phosphate/phosphonate transport system permease subunit
VVERELTRRYYSPWTYMATKLLVDALFLRIIPAAIFTVLFYWIMGLRSSAAAFFTFLWVFCCFCALVRCLEVDTM